MLTCAALALAAAVPLTAPATSPEAPGPRVQAIARATVEIIAVGRATPIAAPGEPHRQVRTGPVAQGQVRLAMIEFE